MLHCRQIQQSRSGQCIALHLAPGAARAQLLVLPSSGRPRLWMPPALDPLWLWTLPTLDTPGSGFPWLWTPQLWTPPAPGSPQALDAPPGSGHPAVLDAPGSGHPPPPHPLLPRGLVCPPRACRGALTTCCLCTLVALLPDVPGHSCPESWLL